MSRSRRLEFTLYTPIMQMITMTGRSIFLGARRMLTKIFTSGRFSTMSMKFPMYMLAMTAQKSSDFSLIRFGPGSQAMQHQGPQNHRHGRGEGNSQGEEGHIGSADGGIVCRLRARPRPSMAPSPNSSGFFENLFSEMYDTKVAITGEGPGTKPIRNPKKDPRNIAGIDRFHSCPVGSSSLILTFWTVCSDPFSSHTAVKTSAMPKIPIATGKKSIPCPSSTLRR